MHAWVEYYLPDVGWIILEVTPGQEQIPLEMDPNDPNIPEKPDRPKPDDPEDPEEPDDPIAGQEPDEPDVDTPDTPELPDEEIPDEEKKDETPEEKEPPIWIKLWPILRIPLLILAILCLILGQWKLRVMRRRKRLNKGRHNRRGQYHWRYLVKLFRLLKETPPEACRELAQKARFSQHTLSEEELRSLEAVEKETIQRLRKKGLLWRFVYTIILAAY